MVGWFLRETGAGEGEVAHLEPPPSSEGQKLAFNIFEAILEVSQPRQFLGPPECLRS